MVGIHSEAFGVDKREENCTCHGFCDSDDKEPKDVEDDHAEEVGLWRARPERGGASNKYTFRTDLQLDLRKSCFHKVLRVQNACNFALAIMLLQKYLGLASFHNYDLASFCKSFNSCKYGFAVFAIFHKVLQFSVSPSFAKFRKYLQIEFSDSRFTEKMLERTHLSHFV